MSPDPETIPYGRHFLPGPTEVHPDVLREQLRPMMAHRGPRMRALMEPIQAGLRSVFGTERPVFVSTSSATGVMEAAIRNGSRERVLSLVNGAFSGRFAKIAELCGREVDRLEVPWGRTHDPDEVRARLAEGMHGAPFDTVTVAHSETSTGALQPLEAISEAVRGAGDDTLLLVDSVSGVGGAPMEVDRWRLDLVLTGSQKALAVPPGLAFVVVSSRLLERAETVPGRGMYFDVVAFDRHMEKLQTPNTPGLSALFALRAQLERIAAEGVEARWARHRALAERCWAWVDRMREERGLDISVVAPRPGRSPTVSCIRLPEGRTGPEVAEAVAERGWVIGSGYGELKATTIRIGHMGDHTVDELDELLEVLEEVLAPVRTEVTA